MECSGVSVPWRHRKRPIDALVQGASTMPRLCPSAAAVGFSVVITLISSAAPSARAAAYEGFDYPLGTLGENRFGGHGFRDYWRLDTDRTEIVAGSLSDP